MNAFKACFKRSFRILRKYSTNENNEVSPKFLCVLEDVLQQIRKKMDCGKPNKTSIGMDVNNRYQTVSVMTSGGSRIIFNAHEYISPLLMHYGGVNDVFITHPTWNNLSGLLSICPSFFKRSEKIQVVYTNVSIYSKSNMEKIWPTLDKTNLVKASFHGVTSEKEIIKNGMKIKPIVFYKRKSNSNQELTDADSSIAYICTCIQNNKISLSKSMEQNSSESCLQSTDDGSSTCTNSNIFMILDVPSVDYLDSLVEQKGFNLHYKTSRNQPYVIVHLSPAEVMLNEKYIQFIGRFSNDTAHFVVNSASKLKDHSPEKSYYYSIFRLLYPDIFENLYEESYKTENPYSFSGQTWQVSGELHYFPGDGIRRTKKLDSNRTIDKLMMKQFNKGNFQNEIDKCVAQRQAVMETRINKKDFPSILFLGTGSAIPTPFRHVSSILVQISKGVSAILDCGNGTWIQMKILYGAKRAREVLKEVKLIFISHHHLDHFAGVFNLLIERKNVFENCNVDQKPKLVILAMERSLNALVEFDKNISPILDNSIELIDSLELIKYDDTIEMAEQLFRQEMDISVHTTTVPHSLKSCGILLAHEDFKIVFSGDCSPSYNLVELGKNCDILIHEASECDSLKHVALQNKHSSVSEAISIGQTMGAKEIYLTHASRKYFPYPLIESPLPQNVALAFDFMKVHIGDTYYLHGLLPALEEIYKESIDQMKTRFRNAFISPSMKYSRR